MATPTSFAQPTPPAPIAPAGIQNQSHAGSLSSVETAVNVGVAPIATSSSSGDGDMRQAGRHSYLSNKLVKLGLSALGAAIGGPLGAGVGLILKKAEVDSSNVSMVALGALGAFVGAGLSLKLQSHFTPAPTGQPQGNPGQNVRSNPLFNDQLNAAIFDPEPIEPLGDSFNYS